MHMYNVSNNSGKIKSNKTQVTGSIFLLKKYTKQANINIYTVYKWSSAILFTEVVIFCGR
jgi:hypothetical protein